MANDPRTPQFWSAEQAALWEVLGPLVMQALLAGATIAADTVPAGVVPLINWDLFNRAALEYLQQYRLSTVAGITRTTRDAAIKAIDDWVRAGEPLPMLQTRLAPLLGKTRADAIAITEVTRIFAEGKRQMWQSTGGVVGWRWVTANDELVCPICRPLHGQIVEWDSNFQLSLEQVASSPAMARLLGKNATPERAVRRAGSILRNIGTDYHRGPPAHVRCRCDVTPVTSEAAIGDAITEAIVAA